MNRNYIITLNDAYNRFFSNYDSSPVIVIDTNEVDFRTDDHHLDQLIELMWKTDDGVHVWIPGKEEESS